MSVRHPAARTREEATVLAAVRGDEATFAAATEPYGRQLLIHCYRMVGSLDEAEDLVQETMLRAWRGRAGFEGRSSLRTWLYRIATNVTPTALERRPRRVLAPDIPAEDATAPFARERRPDLGAAPDDLPWLQPVPDGMLEPAAPAEAEPDEVTVTRETIELVFLAAIQFLPPRQRAVLLLRDVLGWSANDTAGLLEVSTASVNSALQRARSTLRERLPDRRIEWRNATTVSEEERSVLERFIDAHDRADVAAFAALLRDDVRQAMPPFALWFDGRRAVATVLLPLHRRELPRLPRPSAPFPNGRQSLARRRRAPTKAWRRCPPTPRYERARRRGRPDRADLLVWHHVARRFRSAADALMRDPRAR